ncbi:ATP-binding protein [Bradyrhizobium sp. 62B]|uniref:ATP-binding protein n=1 Tax=Bradyrhizobium sp. 62B TaxID=2898442 RepID=UPI0035D83482
MTTTTNVAHCGWNGEDLNRAPRHRPTLVAPGTGKTNLAIAIARSCVRAGARGRFYKDVHLLNRLGAEVRDGRQRRLADHLTRLDFVVLDELGNLPLAQSGNQLPVPPHRSPTSALVLVTTNLVVGNGRASLRTHQDDHRAARPPEPSLGYYRKRNRQLALQQSGRRSRPNARSPRLRNPDQLCRRERAAKGQNCER